VSLRKETLKNRKEDFKGLREKKQSKKKRLIEIRSNEAVVHLHPSTQHT
jgi:hypothetical protein